MRSKRPPSPGPLLLSSLLSLVVVAPALAQLSLPSSRDETIALPDIALPVAGEEPGHLVSLADLKGKKYILHVFASW